MDEDESYVAKNVAVHNCSKYARMDVLNALYDLWADQGITTVYQCGNMIDGEARFNKGDLLAYGIDGQGDYFVEHWPQRKGITTYFVTGDDHEGWYIQREQVNIGELLEQKARKAGHTDLVYLGHMEHDIVLQAPKGRAILRLIHAGGGSSYATCVDADTEILTGQGWYRFPELPRGLAVATMNRETCALEYQVPTDYIEAPHTGTMLHFSGNVADLLVTPNHRMWVRRPWQRWPSCKSTGHNVNQGYQLVTADRIRGRNWCFPKSAQWEGQHIERIDIPKVTAEPKGRLQYNFDSLPAAPFLRLLGWYVSEGNLNHANRQVEINQLPGPRQDEIAALAESLGYRPYVWGAKVRITSLQLYSYLEGSGRSGKKRVPAFIKTLTPELIWEFLEGYLRGDGCKAPRGGGKRKWHSMVTASPLLADDLQELFLKVGLAATVTGRGPRDGFIRGQRIYGRQNQYVVSINYDMLEPTLRTPKQVPFDGTVYCVSVPNELIVVRRNGKIAIIGNSYAPQKIVESYQGGQKPTILLVGHYHKAEYGFPREVHVVQAAATQDQTPFLRKHKIQSHLGGWTISFVQSQEGLIHAFTPRFDNFYDRDFYTDDQWRFVWKNELMRRATKRAA